MERHLLDVRHLKTVFHTRGKDVRAVDDVSFHIDKGEIIGIVGESGSGKSVTMMSILQLLPHPYGEIIGGEAIFEEQDLLKLKRNGEEIRRIRGGGIAMIFQEPMTSLNPVLTVGAQIEESVMLHLSVKRAEAHKRAIELLEMVGIPDSSTRVNHYPSQFSGGMRQRIMIAMALASNPKVLIADEATTALDVTTQEQILDLLRDIAKKSGTALILITHNLSLIARYAERIYVMYAGYIIEEGRSEDIFANPCHPYARALLRAIPRLDSDKSYRLFSIKGMPMNPAQKTEQCPFLPRCVYACEECKCSKMPIVQEYNNGHKVRCWFRTEQLNLKNSMQLERSPLCNISNVPLLEIRNLSKYFPVTKGLLHHKVGDVKALDNISFTVYKGETLGVVGESGCGKTTLAKSILRLYDVTDGQIFFEGKEISSLNGKNLESVRRKVQFIFQDPYGSLDPRQSAGDMVAEAIMAHRKITRVECMRLVDELFRAVELDPDMKERAPHEFSGGQRQRLCIAAGLAGDPQFIICDEPISALDVSIQSQIINLLIDLKSQRGLTYMFIAHDLSVVRHISDRIVVMYLGKVMEISPWDKLYAHPRHPYTKALLSAIPFPDPAIEKCRGRVCIEGEVPSLINRPKGCVFHNRCPYAIEKCKSVEPELREIANGQFVACHL